MKKHNFFNYIKSKISLSSKFLEKLRLNKFNIVKLPKRSTYYWIMLTPALIWLLLFNVMPMFGVLIAFQDYNSVQGIFRSDFIGLENFKYLFQLNDTASVVINTLFISICKVIGNLLIPIIFALLLNEVTLGRFKKSVQTITYLPHFLSWVILGSVVLKIFDYNGIVNLINVNVLGNSPKVFMADEKLFPWIVIWSDIWKNFGFNSIIYLAALTSINPSLYEAVAIDGGNKFVRLIHITLPGILPTIVLLATLSLGNVLNAGFDQIYNLYNPAVYSTGDIIDTWLYRIGLLDLQFSLATAAGLLKSFVSFVLIVISYILAYKYADYTIF